MGETHARGAQIYPYVYIYTFGFRRVTVPQAVGAFGCFDTYSDGEYMKNSVPRNRIHRAGLLH